MEVLHPHVVILPFPAQGHIKPMFILAKLLSQAGLHITFVNTDQNHTSFLNRLAETSFHARFPRIRFVSIPDGLPAEHPRNGPLLLELFNSTRSVSMLHFKELIFSLVNHEQGKWIPPSCIIADGIMSDAVDIARELEICCITFRTYSATCTWVYFHLHKLIQNGEIPVQRDEMDKKVTCVPELESYLRRRDLPSICRREVEDPILQFYLDQTSKMREASALILNTFEELEASVISQLHSIFPQIYTIGPLQGLLASCTNDFSPLDSSSASLRKQDRTCMTWLDSQQSKSVIYVSFGSVAVLAREQLLEFWHGLVNSEKPFLWVIRPDLVWEGNVVGEAPPELAVGTNERWCIVSWAPQEEVLAHKAVGGFLTHSGWNSTLESICAGVPMICWPQLADQQVNSRCVSDMWKTGLDMKDTCDRSTVEKMVRDLMDGKKEEVMKSTIKNAAMARDSVGKDGSSYRNLEKLVEDIRSFASTKNC